VQRVSTGGTEAQWQRDGNGLTDRLQACPTLAGSAEDVSVVVVGSGLTVWLSAVEELPLKLVSPPYVAVIECEPTAKTEVVRMARLVASSGPLPITVAPSLNVTVPEGTPLPGALAVTLAQVGTAR